MAETKYGKHLIKAEIKARDGEEPAFRFSAADYGVDASWVLLPVTNVRPSAEELPPHKHDFHQFITLFGADPTNIEAFHAEKFTCFGEEQERHVHKSPSIENRPPGLLHCPVGWLRVDKPVYQFDIFFAPEWVKTDVSAASVSDKPIEGTKYSKNILRAPIATAKHGPPVIMLNFSAAECGIDAGWIVVPVLEPVVMQNTPHKHDFHQFFCFLGSDPKNIGNLEAEIEVYLGEEGEKHVITTPTVLHIPPGFIHCPMIYTRVDKPVLHLDVYFAPEYKKTEASR